MCCCLFTSFAQVLDSDVFRAISVFSVLFKYQSQVRACCSFVKVNCMVSTSADSDECSVSLTANTNLELVLGRNPQGTVLGTCLGTVLCVRFGLEDHMVAMGAGNTILVQDAKVRPSLPCHLFFFALSFHSMFSYKTLGNPKENLCCNWEVPGIRYCCLC